ncbi:MAG: arginyl-tRNA ligase [Candidatus Aramenus sulfurataquae]|uniref:Arginine--tRNA ligase n=3 Tax=Candidatus Aramenus sulfurataquae TaxID=1326980 RepID=W7KWL1_9CREN|nr:arginyl-tRNA synthetase [Candidatus Aramenus sulfurataquae]EWG07052.1 MAG: arginyl-tRNA ligase [Candidatus Aramenus sulfurataquae]
MNVIREAKREMARVISQAINVEEEKVFNNIEYPSKEGLGDLSLPLPSVTRNLNIDVSGRGKYVKSFRRDGIFINVELDEVSVFNDVFSSLSEDYGLEKVDKPKRIVVEHTSANPIHPLHIGHLRNAILGDTLVRLLRARGHLVNSRFYVNDSGRQVAILIYGLSKLNYPEPPAGVKKDEWLGLIYAMTNVILEIRQITQELKNASESEYKEKISKRDELVAVAQGLRERNEEYFDVLSDGIMKEEDPEKVILDIIERYERGDERTKQIVRKYVNYALEGFMESLGKLGISFDVFDYESDLLWNGDVRKVLEETMDSRARVNYKGTWALDLENFIDEAVKEELRIPKGLELPPLVLMRSDGTTLYTLRDVAYTFKKFSDFKADVVINVIAEQQAVPQMQLRATLYLLGYPEHAKNLLHYSYGMVSLQGMRMSGRLGRYISFDEVYEKVKEVVEAKVREKKGNLEELDEIVNSAIRYAIVSVSANKPVTFNVNKITNLEENSGPYLQYTYARAYNILAKVTDHLDVSNIDPLELVGEKRKILIMIARFPEVFAKAADDMSPEVLTVFLRQFSDLFNAWYDKERVLQEKDEKKRITRIFLVKGVEAVLRNGLKSLGIKPLTKM